MGEATRKSPARSTFRLGRSSRAWHGRGTLWPNSFPKRRSGMAHEIDKERLSAFLDGELAAAERTELLAHLSSCAECSGYVERLRGAAADFKKHGAEKIPAA